jgi:hypothetical protein
VGAGSSASSAVLPKVCQTLSSSGTEQVSCFLPAQAMCRLSSYLFVQCTKELCSTVRRTFERSLQALAAAGLFPDLGNLQSITTPATCLFTWACYAYHPWVVPVVVCQAGRGCGILQEQLLGIVLLSGRCCEVRTAEFRLLMQMSATHTGYTGRHG